MRILDALLMFLIERRRQRVVVSRGCGSDPERLGRYQDGKCQLCGIDNQKLAGSMLIPSWERDGHLSVVWEKELCPHCADATWQLARLVMIGELSRLDLAMLGG